jgi:hypothetical protein
MVLCPFKVDGIRAADSIPALDCLLLPKQYVIGARSEIAEHSKEQVYF